MRVLGVGDYNELGFLYRRLIGEGHDVRVHIAEEGSRDVLAGLVTLTDDWRAELPWVGTDGLVLFEDAGRGETQDALRRDGVRVVGGSAFGDRLEHDRAFGQAMLGELGLGTLPTHGFGDFEAAIAFVRRRPDRYVLKFDGGFLPSDASYVGARDDGADVIAALSRHRRTWDPDHGSPQFILMGFVRGVETGVGAFFDGSEFVGPINLDWEHKRFFPGDLGELTGEMGTVVTYRGGERLFEATLARLAPQLRAAKHVGYVNLNTIIDERGVWPLELTCRFGYPGFAILSALVREPCGELLSRIAAGGGAAPLATHDGFAVGIVLTVPPFPYHHGYEELGKGLPVFVPDDLTDAERLHVHYGEVGLVGGELVTTGQVGYALVVTGRGPTLDDARRAAYTLAAKIAIPNVRYRNDIGEALSRHGLAELTRLGYLGAP